MSQQSPAPPDQPTSQDRPSEPAPPASEPDQPSASKPDQPPASEPATSEPAPSEPAPSEPAPSEPAPSEPAPSKEQPGLPDQPVAAGSPPPPAPTPAPPTKKRRVGLIVAVTVVAALAVVGAGGYFLLSALAQELPQVGDCLTNSSDPNEMEVVECDAAGAVWSVIGSDGSWTRGEFDTAGQGEVCAGFPGTEQALWVTSAAQVDTATDGELLCLARIGDGAATGQ